MKKIISLFCLFVVLSAAAGENNRTLPGGFKTFLQQYESEFSGYGVDPIFVEGQLSYRYSAARAIFDAWVFVDENNEAHLLRLEGLEQYYGVPQKRVRFYDVIPKNIIEVSLRPDRSGQYHYGEMTVGGAKVYVKVYAENLNYPATQLTWGDGSAHGEVGTQTDRFDSDLPFAQPVPPPTVTFDRAKPPIKNCRGMAKEVQPALARYSAVFAEWYPWYYHPPTLVEGELSPSYTSARGTFDGWVIGSRLLTAVGLPTIINGIAGDKITFTDILTTESFVIPLETRGFLSRGISGFGVSGIVPQKYHQGTFLLDGVRVFVQVVYVGTPRYPAVQLTWGAGATYGLVGEKEDRFDCDPPASPPPSIAIISPSPAKVGGTVTVHGTGFRIGTGLIFNSVYIRDSSGKLVGGADVQVTSEDGKTLRFKLPAAVTAGRFTLSVYNWDGGVSPPIEFSVVIEEPPIEPPMVQDELPVPEIVRTTYHLFGDGLFCFIVFQTPAPSGVNRVGWSIQNDHIFEDELFWNADGTGMGFKLLTLPSGLQGRAIDDVRRLFEETPARIRLLRLHR